MGGRFPALAVFGLPALTVALALFVLWGLRPWEDDSAEPHPVPLGIETAVGSGKALSAAPAPSVAKGKIVSTGPGPSTRLTVSAAGGDVSGPDLAVAEGEAAIAPAHSVAPVPSAPAATPAPAPPEAQPVSAPATGTATTPAAPVVATTEGGSAGGPVSAGVGELGESCEGDEYLLTITLLDEEPTADEAPVGIVLARIVGGEAGDELQLEGDLGDARALASTLDSEGNCVRVEIAPRGEDEEGAESSPGESEESAAGGSGEGEETPESGEGVTGLGEAPVLPSP